jgi:hypothetical protein
MHTAKIKMNSFLIGYGLKLSLPQRSVTWVKIPALLLIIE